MSWDDFGADVQRDTVGRRQECSIKLLYDTLRTDAIEHVEAAMSDAGLSSRAIRSALVKRIEGHVPSIWTINRHRRHDCRCYEGT